MTDDAGVKRCWACLELVGPNEEHAPGCRGGGA